MSYRSILIIKPSSLGDVVHTLPAVAAIRDAHPDAKITWVITPEWAPLLRGNRDIDHVHIFPRRQFRGLGASTSLLPWLMKTRSLRPDVAFDFQGLLRSALIGRISGTRELFGLSDAREGSRLFYKQVARVDRHSHAVTRYLRLSELAGAKVDPPFRFPLPSGDPLPRFDPYPPFILLHPVARGRGKSMSNGAIEDFCRACSPARVVIVGKSKLHLRPSDNGVDLTAQTTLLQLVWLIRAARFTVSVDSGPMHIAAAVSSRLIAIHTWTDPRRVGPYNPDAWIWRSGELREMREFSADEKLPKGRAFRRMDVEPIMQLISERWNRAD
ncbi:MAG: glycosyltransferase family 9 protein [Chthoniobacterales bacterium]|nr:glycosyltransferase family 9 protein [Chthoniobacterales bacterium]